MHYEIWHNPKCSKSCKTLTLLNSEGIEPVIRLYQNDAPSGDELKHVLELLGKRAIEITRSEDNLFKELNLSQEDSDEKIIAALRAYPDLIERPIVIKDSKEAVLGRPPENVTILF